jgi:hypothetical protein
MTPKYPDTTVELIGNDGNAMTILGNCTRSARMNGVPQEDIDQFFNEATSGDYDHLLQTCMKWFDVS